LDFSRLRQGEIVAGLAGLALIICMFLPWYGLGLGGDVPTVEIPDIPGIDEESLGGLEDSPEVDDDADAWDSLTDFDGFLIAAAGMAGIALALLAGAGRRLNLGGLPRGSVTAALGALAVGLILWRIFAQPVPGADLEFGIFLGLAAAIGVTVGATMALREGGFEPLVGVTGTGTGARRAASSRSASSRTATTKRAPAKKSGSSRSSGTRKRSGGSK
jgi:hypothetical protein